MAVIKHLAEVVNTGSNEIWIRLCRESTCQSCPANTACGLKSGRGQIYRLPHANPNQFRPGQSIEIEISPKDGAWAIFWAYLLPLILMLSTLVLSTAISGNEITGGICSIIILVPYYIGLFLNQKYFQKKFNFKIIDK